MTDAELISLLEWIRNTLIAVATGGPRIQELNDQYIGTYADVSAALAQRRLENPVPYATLWEWYGRWSTGDLPSYQSRRDFVRELLAPLIHQIRTGRRDEPVPTGWPRVDRTVGRIRDDLARATDQEHFQAVGLLCREAMISVAQVVFDRARHPSIDGADISDTDAKRMLEAYFAVELGGGTNEVVRKHAKSALDLANVLQHRRTAGFRDAALCVEATTTVINVIAIVAGRRDPS
jgi:hypothetical protein